MTLQELQEKRTNIVAQARQIHEGAEAEGRDMTEEEQRNWDKAFDDIKALDERIERERKLEAIEATLGESDQEPLQRGMQPLGGRAIADNPEKRVAELRQMFPNLPDERLQLEARRERTFSRVLPAFMMKDTRGLSSEEKRALQQDIDASGGYLAPPITWVNGLIKAVDNAVFIRQFATKYDVTGADGLGVASLDNDPADPTWTSELLIGSEDSTMSFGDREFNPQPLAQYIKVSRKLLRNVPSADSLVQQRLAYKMSVVQENAFLNGSGANQPLGMFTASDNGISTGQDVSTGNAETSIAFDGLFEAKYGLKPQYRNRASTRWLFHTDAIKQIAKLKDGEGRYIWTESVRVGEPDRVLGIPVIESLYVPNTFTTGLYVGLLGDLAQYWIADGLMMELQMLMELYAGTNQVGMISRSETDGMPVLEEAFVRVKLA